MHKCERDRFICEEEDGEFWLHSPEWSTKVNFCPFCGRRAKQVDETSLADLHMRDKVGRK